MEARKYLYEKEIGSKLTYLEVAQDYAEHEQELQVQRHRLSEADNAVAAIVEQRRQAEAEYRRTVLSDLAQADQKARSLAEELVKAEQKRHR
jgi:hemolysin D